MTIQTRYRDIPFAELLALGHTVTHPDTAEKRWAALRGKPVSIEAPAHPKGVVDSLCCGPFYRIWPYEYENGQRMNVCPHAAEIGD